MISVILLMGGNSSRMNLNENKLFLPLGDKLVFEHSLSKFLNYDFEIICVTQQKYIGYLEKYKEQVKIVIGGNTRQESVYNGLNACSNEYVIIHDAARPFITKKIIDDCVLAINNNQNFLVSVPAKDSVYQINPLVNLKRESLKLAQTPQGGIKKDFINAQILANKENKQFTDDISLVMNYFDKPIQIIDGDDLNFKITTKLDYIVAKEMMRND